MDDADIEVRKRMEGVKRKVVDDVAKQGWAATHVFAGENSTSFTYSIGFHATYQHPEVVILNMPYKVAHGLLAIIAERLARGARFTEPGIEYSEIVGNGYSVRFDPTVRDECYLAHWHSDDECSVMQMLWPDKAGKYPDEDNYDERMVQPLWTR